MRVLVVTDRLSNRGGADLHLLDVIEALVERGIEVEVATGRIEHGPRGGSDPPHPALRATFPHKGGRFCSVPSPLVGEGGSPFGALGAGWGGPAPARRPSPPLPITRIKALASAIPDRRQLPRLDPLLARADIIHVQNVMNPDALRILTSTGRAVVTIQDHRFFCPGPGRTLPDGRPCDRPMSDAACTGCLPDPAYRARTLDLTRARHDALQGARLIVLSRYMAEELDRAGLPGARVIPPWLRTLQVDPVPGEGFVLGGRLVEHKGIELAARAWILADVSAPLHLAGEGPLSHLLPMAIHHGWLDRGQLWALLHGARALLFPSRWQEPFGILAVEALSLGTPVIRTTGGGTDDWAEAGVITVPAGDAEAMARAIRHLHGDPDEALSLGRQGQVFAHSRFARALLEKSLLELYAAVQQTSATGS